MRWFVRVLSVDCYHLAGVENLIYLRNCQFQSFLHLLQDNLLPHIFVPGISLRSLVQRCSCSGCPTCRASGLSVGVLMAGPVCRTITKASALAPAPLTPAVGAFPGAADLPERLVGAVPFLSGEAGGAGGLRAGANGCQALVGCSWSRWFGAAPAFPALLGQSEVTRATDGFCACRRAGRSREPLAKVVGGHLPCRSWVCAPGVAQPPNSVLGCEVPFNDTRVNEASL